MAAEDQLAALLSRNASLFTTYEMWANAQTKLLAGTADDPDSFDATGGKTGDLGYYPVVNVSGETIYVPSLARLRLIAALPGAEVAALIAETSSALTSVLAATVAAQAVVDQEEDTLATIATAAQAVEANRDATAGHASASAAAATLSGQILAMIQALENGGPYANVAAAIASGNVADGANFVVIAGDDLVLYKRNGSGADTLPFRLASATVLGAMRVMLDRAMEQLRVFGENAKGMKVYTGSGDILPEYVAPTFDGLDEILLHGIRKSDGARVSFAMLDGPGFIKSVAREVQKYSDMWGFYGDGPIRPLEVIGRQAIFYFDRTVGRAVLHDVLIRGDHQLETGGSASGLVRGPSRRVKAADGYNGRSYYGQSLFAGASSQPPLSTTQPYGAKTFNGGVKSTDPLDMISFAPLIENSLNESNVATGDRGETLCSGAAKYAVTQAAMLDGVDPSDYIIVASTAAKGGTPFSGLKKGTAQYDKMIGQVQAGFNIAAGEGKIIVYLTQSMGHGESDLDEGTSENDYYDFITDHSDDIDTDFKTVTDQAGDVHLLIYQPSYKAASVGTVQRAQFRAARDKPLIHFVCPTFIFDQAGAGPHLVNTGSLHMAAYFGRAEDQIAGGADEPDAIKPLNAIAIGTKIIIRFKVPKAPLVLDTTLLPATTQFGFKVVDDTGAITLTDGTIVGGNGVQFTLARAVGANPRVRLGHDYLGAGMILTGGGSHNLRDSTADTTIVNNVARPMWHVAPHFELPVIALVP